MDAPLSFLAPAGCVAAGVAAVAFLADRILLAMEARGWVYWRKTKGLSSIGVDLFQESAPGSQAVKKAMEQERVRKNVRPAEDPPFQVNLDSGVVRIRHGKGGRDGGAARSGRGAEIAEIAEGRSADAESGTGTGAGTGPGSGTCPARTE
ncbi:hypothetical protein [Streptomyces sp. NPDC057682]|uniref:hypothetical protein n=1 Tax=unclassified Streptomyces TaxID=2593676 RepID=UPI0036483D5B